MSQKVNFIFEFIEGGLTMPPNGPAVGFSKRYPTTAPPQICPGRPKSCHGARRVRRGYCHPGTSFMSITRVAVQV
jgi:hypothetical protein